MHDVIIATVHVSKTISILHPVHDHAVILIIFSIDLYT